MKSIIQEASSIQKAIEKAWIKADKPREFSVRILEEPVKNFLGFTKKMAKIALFFGGSLPRDGRPSGQHRYRRRHHRRPHHYQDQQHRQGQDGQRQQYHQQQQRSSHTQAPSTPHDNNRVNDNDNNSNNGSSE